LTELDERTILIVFVSLLLERRIIFCSSKLSTLSSCIQAAMAMVYPLTWQHIYIPVLPKSLLTFVCAPMPFVVGILRTELNEVLSLPMDEVLIVDVDNNHFIRTPAASETEDLELLPPNYVSSLRRSLKSAIKVMKSM
jgi:DENN domain-containing protein 1